MALPGITAAAALGQDSFNNLLNTVPMLTLAIYVLAIRFVIWIIKSLFGSND